MTTYVGIDPGLDGAFGVIEDEHVYGIPIPTFWYTLKSGKRRRQYDHMAIRKILEVRKDAIVTIEQQIPLPLVFEKANGIKQKQRATSLFTTGYGFGVLMGLLAAIDITTKTVHPKTWQAAFFKRENGKTTKEQALEVVNVLFTNINLFASERSTKEHDGIIDALLICEYGRRLALGVLKK